MKRKLRWLLLLVPLALLIWAYQAASWRPKLIGVAPTTSSTLMTAMGMFSGPRLLISPDGKMLATGSHSAAGTRLSLWQIDARRQLWQQAHNADPRLALLAFSPDSRTLAVAEESFRSGVPNVINILLVDSATGKQRRLPHSSWQDDLQSAAFLSVRELVVSTPQGFWILDAQTGKTVRQRNFKLPRLRANEKPELPRSAVSADGTTVTVAIYRSHGNSFAHTIGLVYDSGTGQLRHQWTNNDSYSGNLRLSPDGKLWATQFSENCCLISVHDNSTGKQAWQRDIETGESRQNWNWSADSRSILSSPSLGTLLTDKNNGRDPIRLPGPSDAVAVALAPDGDYFYSLDDNGRIWRWRAR